MAIIMTIPTGDVLAHHHRPGIILVITLVVIITFTIGFVGTAAADQEPRGGMFDPWFNVKTSIAYSSGSDKEWAYGNQQKEFSTYELDRERIISFSPSNPS